MRGFIAFESRRVNTGSAGERRQMDRQICRSYESAIFCGVSERTLLLGLHRLGVAQNTPYASKGPYDPNLRRTALILLVCGTTFLGTTPHEVA
jgi:hypothetical protein